MGTNQGYLTNQKSQEGPGLPLNVQPAPISPNSTPNAQSWLLH